MLIRATSQPRQEPITLGVKSANIGLGGGFQYYQFLPRISQRDLVKFLQEMEEVVV